MVTNYHFTARRVISQRGVYRGTKKSESDKMERMPKSQKEDQTDFNREEMTAFK